MGGKALLHLRDELTVAPLIGSRQRLAVRQVISGRAVRVLIVDDLADAADSLARLLRILGFETRIAYSGEEALHLAREYRPDCLLSDVGMPGIDGYQLAGLIRQEESLKPILLIAITAYADAERAKNAGFDHHLVKPADPYALVELLEGVLQMDDRLERAEKVIEKQGVVVEQAVEVLNEVKADVKDIKQGLQDVKEIKQELQEIKEDVKEIKEELKDSKTSTG